MASFLKAAALLAVSVAASPVPDIKERDVDATITVGVTATSTYLYTLIPPVVPGTTTVVNTSIISCTTTAFLPVPTARGADASIPSEIQSFMSAQKSDLPSGIEPRQASTTSFTVAPAPTTTSDVTITDILATQVVTATVTLSQRPPVTRTFYSITIETETAPRTRTVYVCAVTYSLYYAIVTDTSSIPHSTTVFPSTETVCPATATAAPVAPTPAIAKRQTTSAPATTTAAPAPLCTTITHHRVTYVYAVTTITAAAPRTITAAVCSATPAA